MDSTSVYRLLTLASAALMFVSLVTGLLFVAGRTVALQESLYDRCLIRDRYDRATQDARVAQRNWFKEYIRQEASNVMVPTPLREARVAAATEAMNRLDDAIQTGAPTGCGDLS